jgi:hypothetical protein
MIYDTDVHAPRVQINTTVKGVLVGVESPEILCRRTGHTHDAMVKLLEELFTKKEPYHDHSSPNPHYA